ncbi:MAG TPA: alpha/beta hydrolase [Candidatus Binataceae bacterium]|jgi:acetyl esterase|nr:alpha/beta hydrolase [Candidatus Binataceae bacterium]
MPLDPQMKAILDKAAAAGNPPFHKLTPAAARAFIRSRPPMGAPESVAHVEDRRIPGPAGQIPIRIYRPIGSAPLPAVVFFHGGGWVVGDIEMTDPVCRILTNAARCATVSVDYRLAPEHRFPAGPEDCYAATRWVAENAAMIGADPARLAVAGTSAGASLATVAAMMARDRGGPQLGYQVLWYPATDAEMDTPSHRNYATDSYYFLSRADMEWFWGHYLSSERDKANPYCAPAAAKDLSGLPPALVITAEYDPLRDEGEEYAARLRRAGVATRCTRYEGVTHGFVGMAQILAKGRQAVEEAAAALRETFGR